MTYDLPRQNARQGQWCRVPPYVGWARWCKWEMRNRVTCSHGKRIRLTVEGLLTPSKSESIGLG